MLRKCFVIRPFRDKNNNWCNDIYIPAMQKLGLTPVHGYDPEDPKIFSKRTDEILLSKIARQINDAHICIVDISEDNPNVSNEIAIALESNKQVVLVRHDKCEKKCEENCQKGCHKNCSKKPLKNCHTNCHTDAKSVPSNIRGLEFVNFRDCDIEKAKDKIERCLSVASWNADPFFFKVGKKIKMILKLGK